MHWGRVTHICVSKPGHHWFRYWFVSWAALSHYLNQWWNIANWTLRNKLRYDLSFMQFIHENAIENVVWEMAAILFGYLLFHVQCRQCQRDANNFLQAHSPRFSLGVERTAYRLYHTKLSLLKDIFPYNGVHLLPIVCMLFHRRIIVPDSWNKKKQSYRWHRTGDIQYAKTAQWEFIPMHDGFRMISTDIRVWMIDYIGRFRWGVYALCPNLNGSLSHPLGPLLLTCVTLVLAWISNYIHYKSWSAERCHFSIQKLQWCNRWSLGVDK